MMTIKRAIGYFSGVAMSMYALLNTAFAQTLNGSQNVTLSDPLGGNESFVSVANNVAQFLVQDIAIPLTIVMVLVGSFQIMTSAGNPEKVSTGRKTIMYAAIGFIAALISLGAVNLIKSFLGQ